MYKAKEEMNLCKTSQSGNVNISDHICLNDERLLVALIADEVREHCILANSQSISYKYIRKIVKEYGIYKSDYDSDQYLKSLFIKYEGNMFMQLDTFGADETFIDEDDEELFDSGEMTEKDGFVLIIPDDFLHSNYESFYFCERAYYKNDGLLAIEKGYKEKHEFLSGVEKNVLSIAHELENEKTNEDEINYLFFALVDLMKSNK